MDDEKTILLLNGDNLSINKALQIANGKHILDLTEEAWERVRRGRKVIQNILDKGQVVYGVNTGFGNFADVRVSNSQLTVLQINLIRSHAAGVGETLSIYLTRLLLALRINTLAKGYSGISEETLSLTLKIFNADCLSAVPMKGTLGASGDLAPLAHLTLGMLGEGKMWDPRTMRYEPAEQVLKLNGLKPLDLKAKEGLALINGTQFITSLGVDAWSRAWNLCRSADIIAALVIEALKGSFKAFFPQIHQARPHKGQIHSAANILKLLHSKQYPSEIWHSHENCTKVQDAYSLRCTPQVHGIVYDTLTFVKNILETEMNSATDNPMVFAEDEQIISGGNFHGEYPAKALDYLAIATHELGSISERRVERMLNSNLSELFPFLVKEGGLNSGFMIAQCTAAALVSENKTLCHPASVDSIPTSAQKEDHVSMGGWAARKALKVVANVEYVLAIELMCASQALDFRRPLCTTEPLERLHSEVRKKVAHWEVDRFMNPDIETLTQWIREGGVIKTVEEFFENESLKSKL